MKQTQTTSSLPILDIVLILIKQLTYTFTYI